MSEEVVKIGSIYIPVDWMNTKNTKNTKKIQEYVDEFLERTGEIPKTEDAEFEIIDNSKCVFDVKRIEDRMKQLGYLEDIDC